MGNDSCPEIWYWLIAPALKRKNDRAIQRRIQMVLLREDGKPRLRLPRSWEGL
jgi:hypothetical protein